MRTMSLMRVLAVAAAFAQAAPSFAQAYRCVPLTGANPAERVFAQRVSDGNEAVGTIGIGYDNYRAVIFRPDGTPKYIHDVPSYGVAINDRGNAVFTLIDPHRSGDAVGVVFYDAVSGLATPVTLPSMPFINRPRAAAIDNANTIFGVIDNWQGATDPPLGPFMVRGGRFTDFGPVLGQTAVINNVSSTGVVVGTKPASDGTGAHAYRFDPKRRRLVDLNQSLRATASVGYGINASLTVTGARIRSSQTGFVASGRSVADVDLPDSLGGYVVAINDANEAVGYELYAGAPGRAMHWRAGVTTDLSAVALRDCGVEITSGNDINQQGAIVGFSGDRSYLLVPVAGN